MRIRRYFMGAAALALPLGSLAAFEGSAGAAKPPPNPITCAISASVQFGTASDKAGTTFLATPLTTAGVQVASSAFYTATKITATLSACTGAAVGGNPTGGTTTFTFTSSAVKGGKPGSPAGSAKGTFWTNVCAGAATNLGATLKTLKGLKFSQNWSGGVGGTSNWKGSGSSLLNTNNLGELGYGLTGTVSGSYATAKKSGAINAYLVNDDDANAYIGGCLLANGADFPGDTGQTGQVGGFHIDGTTSTAVL